MPGSFAVLNHDDVMVDPSRDHTRAHVMTYGFNECADVRVVRLENRTERWEFPRGSPLSLNMRAVRCRSASTVSLVRRPAYAAAAACRVGLIFNMNLVTISEALAEYVPAPSRMELLPGHQAYACDRRRVYSR